MGFHNVIRIFVVIGTLHNVIVLSYKRSNENTKRFKRSIFSEISIQEVAKKSPFSKQVKVNPILLFCETMTQRGQKFQHLFNSERTVDFYRSSTGQNCRPFSSNPVGTTCYAN